MENMSQFTHIGRPVDLRYPTNRIILLMMMLTTVAMLVFQLLSGTALIEAGLQAISAGLTIFFVWAFAREIDPQEQLSAFVAVLLTLIMLFIVDADYNLLALFFLMSVARVVNRSVGLPLKLNDSVLVLIFAGFVAYLSGWIFALIAAVAFLLDSFLPESDSKHRLFAGLAFLMMIVFMLIQQDAFTLMMPTQTFLIGIVLAGLIFMPLIWSSRQVTAVCDMRGQTLSPIRVQATQLLMLMVAFVLAFLQGNEGILAFLPLWITLVGVGLFPLIKPFLPDINLEKSGS